MQWRTASAVVLLGFFLVGMLSPAACAAICAHRHGDEAHGLVNNAHHHACELGMTDMRGVRAAPCHGNCSPAMSALRSSAFLEMGLHQGIAPGAIAKGITTHTAAILSRAANGFDRIDSRGPSLPVLRI